MSLWERVWLWRHRACHVVGWDAFWSCGHHDRHCRQTGRAWTLRAFTRYAARDGESEIINVKGG